MTRVRNLGAPPRRRGPAPSTGGAYARIIAVVRRIPRGRVATYGEVATLAGYPHAPRLAGYALHALPDGSPVPWHRVLGAGGKLSLARLSPDGALLQKLKLEAEGVAFDPRGRVRLAQHGWPRARKTRAGGAPRRTARTRAKPTGRSARR